MAKGRPSKTVEWPDHGQLKILPDNKVYTCVCDAKGRPSAVPEAKEGQKCIVILLDEENAGKEVTEKKEEDQ